jgi:uncharacterized protein with von Willebrand factor type A (vWA) domain
MSDDLRKLLDDTPDDLPTGEISGSKPIAPPTPTALKLDRWSIRRGKDWANTTDIAGCFEVLDRDSFHADMLASAWEPSPQLSDNSAVPHLHHFLDQLMQTPEYEALHRQTRLDNIASEIAAANFARKYMEYAKEDDASPDTQPGDGESDDDKLDRDAKAIGAAMAALRESKKEVDELNSLRDSLGGDGTDPSQMSADRVRDLFVKMRDSDQLRRIMQQAGRYLRMAQSMQRSKPIHGPDETVGIEHGDDLSRILSSEYVYLDDDLENEFLLRFTERSLMVRDVRSVEDAQAGPIVVVVDESGSMRGDRVAHAKAMALAMLWVAEHQKRWCCLVGFAGGSEGNFLTIPPGERDIPSLVAWLEHFYGGGTTCDVPLQTLPSKWNALGCPEGQTDIIQITDCALNVPDSVTDAFLSFKSANRVQLNTIVIGDKPGDMEKVSDKWWTIHDLNIDTECVAQCLSV